MSYVPSSFDNLSQDEDQVSFSEKFIRQCKQQPLVPLGAILTTAAVTLAAKNVKSGNKTGAQKWFRWRVALQTFTLVALIGGSFIYGKKQQPQIDGDELLRQKAKMREQLWIEELERRDQEIANRKKRAELARQKVKEMEKESSQLQKELQELESKIKK
ncbi:HFL241Wp [Eremothecium sinecaudum]|uniref:Respiratory supercomplex factor 1, mitochondrial n=1 Tax=Eremothecium sinecaudum TaxID=45286 RepID=A0A109UZL6_9SACH|nr:HFL241Wp [Eremothecium sinecaudum]AMD21615.1 HFL241Wp [Eremothecium sinecaudum]